ncbi:MAG: BRcat domain-containing protein [Fimbriiglobus sp.]
MPAMKCPNPVCEFRFDPSRVPAGVVINCPQCQMRYRLQDIIGTFDPGQHPSIPADHQPTLPIGSATVNTPAPIGSSSRSSQAAAPVRRPGNSGSWKFFLAIAGFITLMVGVILGAVLLKKTMRPSENSSSSPELLVPDRNFAFKPPVGWVKDTDMQNSLGVNAIALQREKAPHGWMALHVIDFKERNALTAELREEMMRVLNRQFQFIPPDLNFEDTLWGSLPARKAAFRGELKTNNVVCVGEVHVLSHKGLGYWLYTFAAEAEASALATDLGSMLGQFRVLEQRANWKEAVSNELVYRSQKPNGIFRISNYEKIWTNRDTELASEDPNAELVLRGVLKGKGRRDFHPEADLVVMVVSNSGADAMRAAKEYVSARYTKDPETFGKKNVTEVTTQPSGDEQIGPESKQAPVMRLQISPADANISRASEKLVVYSAIIVGDKLVIAEASCPWPQRETWEKRLIQLTGSLRP